jgi:hypothetical protein
MSFFSRNRKRSFESSPSSVSVQSTRQSTTRRSPSETSPITRLGPRSRHSSAEPSPWSVHHLNLLPPTFLNKSARPSELSPSPFPRVGHALSANASATGELFLFGGFVGGSARNDLYAFSWWELSATLSATLLQTSGEVPSPRLRHAGARFDTVLLIWGGATKVSDQGEISGPYDDSLYLLDIGTSDLFDVKTDSC